ncbi:major facilitator superfamily domain-containing protein 6-like [Actinia tenebrosa]|uniref:Major facilitator superfamily domain-containing protein 6-like n=1 Tax=Actinia tenebrosa TaxID=6105 RepID=A0A6P8IZA5_ACTTE|nr:major facilitator superfamily domain-containing protein 6-like [Actinia tenebrosa]
MEASAIHRHQNIRRLKGLLYIENRTLRFKAFYLVFFFGCGTLRNYLPVYFRHIGLNAVLTGVITGVRPFTGFISAPFFSFLADKTGCYKSILLLSLVMSVLAYFSLSFVAFVQQAKEVQPIEHVIKSNITLLQRNSIKFSTSYTTRDRGFSFGGNHHGNDRLNYPLPNHTNMGITQLDRSGKNPRHGPQFADSGLYYANESLVPLNDTSILSESMIFFASFGLIVIGDFFNAPVGAIMCSTIFYWEGSSQFGKQRVFGAIGFGLGSFLTGMAIDKTVGFNYFQLNYLKNDGSNESNPNYLTAFFLYLGVNSILLMFVSCGLDVSRESKSKIIMTHVKKILSRGMVVCFLIYIFIMGVVGGTIMLFLFWFLENLGASQSLLGLSSAIMSISEVPIFPLCAKMINAIGHVGVLFLSLTCSIIRLTCYTFLQDPWYVLLIEPLHGISLAAMWSTSISFACAVSTPDVYTTMEGVTTGFHYGLGWGLGAVIGGAFYNLYGPRNLFRWCILLCCVGYIFLGLVYILQRKDHSSVNYYRLDNNRQGSVNVDAEYEVISGDIYLNTSR